jgi:hypothetical protein
MVEPKYVECGWDVPIGVSNSIITGGFAGAIMNKNTAEYETYKQAQEEQIDVFGHGENVTVTDKSGIVNCTQSRMTVIKDKGVPMWSYFTALCDGLVIVHVTSGREYSIDNDSRFQQIVQAFVGDRRK